MTGLDVAPEAPGSRDALRYAGAARPLFAITVRGLLLTFLTLGIYRFWLLTHQRRHYWNAVRLQGEPLEYLGRPGELLLGFLIAVAVLAAVLGVFNVLLIFSGLTLGAEAAAPNMTLLLVVPLIHYARYRRRRYLLARTRWRGIRFGMADGAWSYAGRGLAWTLATGATAGLIWPLMQTDLRRFKTRRTSFGDRAFGMDARGAALMIPWLQVWLPGVLGFIGAFAAGIFAALAGAQDGAEPGPAAALILAGLLALWAGAMAVLYARYHARAHNLLLSRTTLGGLRFAPSLRTGRVVRVGGRALLAVGLTAALAAAAAVALGLAVAAAIGAGQGVGLEEAAAGIGAEGWPAWAPTAILLFATYALFVSVVGAVYEVTFVQALLAAYVETAGMSGARTLDDVRQRPGDAAAEAGGFADALDVGGGAF